MTDAEHRERYQRYLANRMPLEGLLPQHGDECEFDHCVCALSERKETAMAKGRDIDQQIADLAREKAKRLHHSNARALLGQLKTSLHEREYAVSLAQAQQLVKALTALQSTQGEPAVDIFVDTFGTEQPNG